MVKRAREQVIHGKVNRAQANSTRGQITHRSDISIAGVCPVLDIHAGRHPIRIQVDANSSIGGADIGNKGTLNGPLAGVFRRADVHMIAISAVASVLIQQQVEGSIHQSVVAVVHSVAVILRHARGSPPVAIAQRVQVGWAG